jgi:2-methylisocitrate lyase-like PEP mutase family enzyme
VVYVLMLCVMILALLPGLRRWFFAEVKGSVATMSKPKSAFRLLHEREGAFIIPNPWDAGSAHILAAHGFEALATTSSGMAFSMARPEGSVSRDATFAHCREIVAATSLPVSADLERGFGDLPEDVAQAVRDAGAIGLVGCSIEDHTGSRDNPIYDFGLAVERIAAAVEVARNLPADFVLTARCENLLWDKPKLDDVIERLQAYEKAGADVLFAPGLRDLVSIKMVCDALSKPVNVVMETTGKFNLADLAEAGVKRVSTGSKLASLAYGGLVKAAREMKEKGSFGFAADAMGFDELARYFDGQR